MYKNISINSHVNEKNGLFLYKHFKNKEKLLSTAALEPATLSLSSTPYQWASCMMVQHWDICLCIYIDRLCWLYQSILYTSINITHHIECDPDSHSFFFQIGANEIVGILHKWLDWFGWVWQTNSWWPGLAHKILFINI